MGYTTEFEGRFELDRELSTEDFGLLRGLAETRRMKRNLPAMYGVDGEFFIDGEGLHGQGEDPSIVDYNTPPKTQPSLWCQWTPTEDRKAIEWDGVEKFYSYVEWLKYLINTILEPRGYTVNGGVTWQGEDPEDMGKIVVKDNAVTVLEAKITYE